VRALTRNAEFDFSRKPVVF